jgi:hypothetical protein
MGDIEWVRITTIVISSFAIGLLSWLYMKKRQPIIFAGIAWLVLSLGYSIFKIIVDGNLAYYNASIIYNAFILTYGAILLIVLGLAFRDLK